MSTKQKRVKKILWFNLVDIENNDFSPVYIGKINKDSALTMMAQSGIIIPATLTYALPTQSKKRV